MCALSKEQSILSKETNQNAFCSELFPFFNLDFLFSVKHPTAERWHPLLFSFGLELLKPSVDYFSGLIGFMLYFRYLK